jgi:hypothetical protein
VIRTKQGRKKFRSIERQFQRHHLEIVPDGRHRSTLHPSRSYAGRPKSNRNLRRHLLSKLQLFSTSALQSISTHIQAVKLKLASVEPPKSRLPLQIKHTIRNTLEQAWRREWHESLQGDTTRSFFPFLKCFIQLKILNLPHQVIQMLTGHSLLNAHQYLLKSISL